MSAHKLHPCPCDGCDGETIMEDEYCTKCLHEGCGYEVKCNV